MIQTPLPLLAAMLFLIGCMSILMGLLGRDDGAHLFRIAGPSGLHGARAINFDGTDTLMCGIAGFVGAGDRDDLVAMTGALAHRGPTAKVFTSTTSDRVFLGHRRLAIIDIAGGDQPMWNEDGTVGVIFNGEIYNHAELRRELEALRPPLPHRPLRHRSPGSRLRGVGRGPAARASTACSRSASTIDARKRLFLARDRFGEKPLYYVPPGRGLFAFASELTAHCLRIRRVRARSSPQRCRSCSPMAISRRRRDVSRACAKLPGGHG